MPRVDDRDRGERRALLVPVDHVGPRQHAVRAVAERSTGALVPHEHQAIRIVIRQRPKQHRVHQAEDRSVRADPEREDADDGRSEEGTSTEEPQGVADVSHNAPTKGQLSALSLPSGYVLFGPRSAACGLRFGSLAALSDAGVAPADVRDGGPVGHDRLFREFLRQIQPATRRRLMRRRSLGSLMMSGMAAVAALIFTLPALRAQQAPAQADAEYLRKAYDTYRSMTQSSPYKGVPWQYLGPTNISGTRHRHRRRGSRRRPAGSTSPTPRAASGRPTTTAPRGSRSSTIRPPPASATSPSRRRIPDIVWVGTGEANLFRASMAGVGIYKSTDGGRTFAHSGLTDTHTIARILVHPDQPRHRLRRGVGSRVDRQRDARRVQDDRRRADAGTRSSTAARGPARSTS